MRYRGFVVQTLVIGALLLAFVPAQAVTVLDFEGLQDSEQVEEYYNGGFGSKGSGPGPSYGVSFEENALALIDADAGGNGNFANEPTPDTILYFLSGGAATMTYAAGFDTGFSFFYAALDPGSFVNVWDGENGAGNLLATLTLGATPTYTGGDPTGIYSEWAPIGVTFAGVAKSVDFGGAANYVGFDNITFGSEVPQGVPEGGSCALLLAIAGAGCRGIARRKR